MSEARPPTTIALEWQRDLAFTISAGPHGIVLDGDGKAGASPVQALAAALCGCIASDLALILTRGRQPLASLRATFSGERAPTEPRRFVRIAIHFVVGGAVAPAQLERAVQLSREKYCSVWHSMRQDIPLEITTEIVPAH